MTPSEISGALQPVSAISIPSAISWADEERDITAWMGNELQVAALDKLYSLSAKVEKCDDLYIQKDWEYLQSSDHFYYMATKFFSDGAVHAYFNPYENPYDAFMNYMNVLSDFEIRLKKFFPDTAEQELIFKLGADVYEKDNIIAKQNEEIQKLTKKIARAKPKAKVMSKKLLKEAESGTLTEKIKKTQTRVAKTKTVVKKPVKKRTSVKKEL